jgi:hypothetical protein
MRILCKGVLSMENRNFQLDTEWNIIQYPEKPTGFGVLIIGDERHFVDESKSFWMQNEGKNAIISKLKDEGYTIFSSNLYGRNWGSDRAVQLAKRLYQHVIRSEILNEKIHILAEGMGALVALKLLREMPECLRSVVLINPVLSLKHHLEQEKTHKFFYKKLVTEIAEAYQEDSEIIVERFQNQEGIPSLNFGIPITVFHILAGGRSFNQSKISQALIDNQKGSNMPISASYMLPEKKQQLGPKIIKFYKTHESVL